MKDTRKHGVIVKSELERATYSLSPKTLLITVTGINGDFRRSLFFQIVNGKLVKQEAKPYPYTEEEDLQ